MHEVPIGHAANASGVKIPTIRSYEKIGLLLKPMRTESQRRLYTEADLRRLTFIRHARDLGFDVDAIRALLALQDQPGQSCANADAIAKARLADVEERIARLTALQSELKRMIAGCRHGRVDECRVIEVVGDHGLCLSATH